MARKFVSNIVGGISRYDLSKIGQGYSLNMYEETTNSSENYVSKVLRPIEGYEKVADISGTCRGMFTVSNGYNGKPITYCVFDNKLYLLTETTYKPYLIGTITQGQNKIHFAETGNSRGFNAHLIIVDGFNCFAVDTQIRPALQVEDFRQIQLPYRNYEEGGTENKRIEPTHCAYLYGYLVVNDKDTDNCYLSYQFPLERNDGNNIDYNIFMVGSEEWGYLGQTFQSYYRPDNTTAIVANGSRLFTFGMKSTQMWQYANDLNVPFNSPDTASSPIGLKAINSLVQVGTTIIWLGANDIGNNGIYVCDTNMNMERVSTPQIEREFNSAKTLFDSYAQVWQANQHIFYTITIPDLGKTYCYDLTEKSWSERCSLNNENKRVCWRYDNAVMDSNGNILQSFYGGIAKQTDKNWVEHDGTPILRLRRGGVIQSNYKNFVVDDIEIITNNGQYSLLDPSINAKMMMRYSVDGGNWTDLEYVDIGKQGNYDYDCIFYNFGVCKDLTIELSCTDNIPFALFGININAEELQY